MTDAKRMATIDRRPYHPEDYEADAAKIRELVGQKTLNDRLRFAEQIASHVYNDSLYISGYIALLDFLRTGVLKNHITGTVLFQERYFVDQRNGSVAVRDRVHTDPEYQGLHGDTRGVVWYKHGELVNEKCPTCGHHLRTTWHVRETDVEKALEVCRRLNAGEDVCDVVPGFAGWENPLPDDLV